MQALSRRCARSALQAAVRRQGYSTSMGSYAATAENLRINGVRDMDSDTLGWILTRALGHESHLSRLHWKAGNVSSPADVGALC